MKKTTKIGLGLLTGGIGFIVAAVVALTRKEKSDETATEETVDADFHEVETEEESSDNSESEE